MKKTPTEYMREWRERNAEKNREYQKSYYKEYSKDKENVQKARDRAKEWYWSNRESALSNASSRYIPKGRSPRFGEDNPTWKGDAAKYHAIHKWVQSHAGKPSKCEHCGDVTAKRYEWANIDHRYRRVLSDYLRLCHSCHYKYDVKMGHRKPLTRKKEA